MSISWIFNRKEHAKNASVPSLNLFLILLFLLKTQLIYSDSIYYNNKYLHTQEGINFSSKQLILPAAFITIGTIGLIEKDLDRKIRDEFADHQGRTKIDNILPFLAPGAVYILNWSQVQGKHNFMDRTVLLGTSAAITGVLIYSTKYSVKRDRPDESGSESFPSMHTAIAFMGAEFLRQEFGDQSIWYGIAGYTFATGTGLLRMYNNRHWFSDVAAGAGIGILSTKIAYWIYPEIRKLYAGTKLDGFQFMPFLSSNDFGVSITARF